MWVFFSSSLFWEYVHDEIKCKICILKPWLCGDFARLMSSLIRAIDRDFDSALLHGQTFTSIFFGRGQNLRINTNSTRKLGLRKNETNHKIKVSFEAFLLIKTLSPKGVTPR